MSPVHFTPDAAGLRLALADGRASLRLVPRLGLTLPRYHFRLGRVVHAAAELDALLSAHGLTRDDVTEFLYHPGGPKVLQAYADAYGVDPSRFAWSRDVFRDFGNMSSVTVLYVLERYLAAHPPSLRLRRDAPGAGGHAVVSALGPGFSSEGLVLRL